MSRSRHRQRSVYWEAPPISPGTDAPLQPVSGVASAAECTGLELRPPQDQAQAEHDAQLFGIHKSKPQSSEAH